MSCLGILILSSCADKTEQKAMTQVTVNNEPESPYVEKGEEIVLETFAVLSKKLQKAMAEGGVKKAVNYCNIAASPLVDSLENTYNVSIKRTSLKLRNPQNSPTPNEKRQLLKYERDRQKGIALKPVVKESKNKVEFYSPISIMPLCQKCHGRLGKEMKIEDYKHIQHLYPFDGATHYVNGDLRGIWSVTFHETASEQ